MSMPAQKWMGECTHDAKYSEIRIPKCFPNGLSFIYASSVTSDPTKHLT